MDRMSNSPKKRTQSEITHNAVIYTYPGGYVDVICASEAIFREPGWEAAFGSPEDERAKPAPREAGKKSEGADMERSMRRARAKLRRLALANGFDYFVTLTLDAGKIDRYDGAAITRVLGRWADNMVRRHGLRYILVPEQHKDGAFHFHGFMAGRGLESVDSGTIKRPGVKKPQRPRSEAERERWLVEGGQIVYNLPQWPYGFTTALELYGEYSAAVVYCCKYIGKQNGERPLGRWYYSGGQLAEPEKLYTDLEFRAVENSVEFSIPGAKMKVLHQKQEENV